MGSRIVCACGATLRKNVFSGHNLSLLVPEECIDRDLEGKSAEDLVSRLVLSAPKVVTCEACNRLHVLDESGAQPPRVYVLEVASDTKY